MLPGPVQVHPRIQQAMLRPIIGHRSQEFKKLYHETVNLLKTYLQTEYDTFLITGSGTAAVEACISNLIDPANPPLFLALVNGKFGSRMADIAEAFGARVIRAGVNWGKAITTELVEFNLSRYPEISTVLVCHNETSTGVLNPLKKIGDICHKHDKLLVADVVTSFGSVDICPKEMNVDMLAAGSQKCIGIPPGLSFVTISLKAWERMPKTRHSYYLDLEHYKENALKDYTPWTPAITLVYGLREALLMALEEGVRTRHRRQATSALLLRIAMQAMGLGILANSDCWSPIVTAVKMPTGIDPEVVIKGMREFGVLVAASHEHLKRSYIRIGTLNNVDFKDVLTTVGILEIILTRNGYITNGDGTKAILETLWAS